MLAEQAERDGFPTIIIPSGLPPRTAIGYAFFPGLILFHRLGLISDKTNDAQEVITLLLRLRDQYATKAAIEQNLAKQIASRLYGKLAVIYGVADRLDSIVTRWRTQINENSKMLVNTQVLPELNHNEIVGWEVTKELLNKMHVIFIRDKENHPQIQKRIQITHKLILDLADGVTEVWTTGDSWLARLWSVLFLGDFVSYYLAILNEVDPTPVKKISYLKEKLARG
jgi:glucose/mannose-6-phosphate isomerase